MVGHLRIKTNLARKLQLVETEEKNRCHARHSPMCTEQFETFDKDPTILRLSSVSSISNQRSTSH